MMPGASEAYHAFPRVLRDKRGTVWVASCILEGRRETICLRSLGNDGGGIVELGGDAEANGPPEIAQMDEGLAVVWAAYEDGEWSVRLARVREGGSSVEETVLARRAWQPRVLCAGELWVTWVSTRTGRVHVWRESGGEEVISPPGCQRPAIDVCGDEITVAWDRYDGCAYSVQTRSWGPGSGFQWRGPGKINLLEEWASCVALASDGDWLQFAAWAHAADVRDGNGVIDQRFGIHWSVYDQGDTIWWPPDEERQHAVDLCHGLLAREEIWGYIGRRRQPMLRRAGDGTVWLLWERKVNPDGPLSAGELLGAPMSLDGPGDPVRLAAGRCFYEPEVGPLDDDTLWVASRLPKGPEAWDIHLEQVRLSTDAPAADVSTDDWARWQPISLPRQLPRSPARPLTREGDQALELYFGDVHAHSGLSADAEGEPDEVLHYARDKAGLDFVAMIDNDCYQCPLLPHEFETMRTLADSLTRDGEFVVLPGYEWTLWDKENCPHPDHRTVLFGETAELIRHVDTGAPTTAEMAQRIAEIGGMLFTQHWGWTLTDSPAETALEVTSAWRYYIDRPEPFHRDLLSGRRLGFVGGSDSHRRNPGLCGALTGVYAESLTREAILDALRARRCYATSGSRMVLDVRVNGAPMGSEIESGGEVTLSIIARGTRELTRLEIFRGSCEEGEVRSIHEADLSDLEAQYEWTDPAPPPGLSFYYVVIHQQGRDIELPSNLCTAHGCRAWSSPVWVTR